MISPDALIFLLALVIIVFLVWLLSLILASVSQDDPDDAAEADNQASPTGNLKDNPEGGPSGSAIAEAIHAYRRTRHSHERQSGQRVKQANAILGATALFALVAAVAAIFSGWAFYSQLTQMRHDGRPWVGIGYIGYPEADTAIQFMNGGKSPALNISMAAYAWEPSTPDDRPILPTARCEADCRIQGLTLLPNIPFQFVLSHDKRDRTIWLIGRADYDDIDGAPHKTGVCLLHIAGSHDVRDCPIPNSNYAD